MLTHENTSRYVSRTARFVLAGGGLSVSIQRNASAASTIQKGVPFAIVVTRREPDAFTSTALTQGRLTTVNHHVASLLDTVSPLAAGIPNRAGMFSDQRSRNVLNHHPSARRITSLIKRTVRARTTRCRNTTGKSSMSPDDNGATEASRNHDSATTCKRRISEFRKTLMTSLPRGESAR